MPQLKYHAMSSLFSFFGDFVISDFDASSQVALVRPFGLAVKLMPMVKKTLNPLQTKKV